MAGVVAEEAARQWECDLRPSGQTVTKVYSSEENMAVVALKVQLTLCVRIAEVSTNEFSTTVLWLLSSKKRKEKWIPEGKSLLSTTVSESPRALYRKAEH